MPWVYILFSKKSNKYYVGSTTDINNRVRHHQGGYTPSTKRLGSVSLIFRQEYPTLNEARKVEKRLKKLKRRDYLEKIIKDGCIKMKI